MKQQVRKLPSLWKQCHPLYVHYSCLNLQMRVLTQIKDVHTNGKGRPKLKVIKQVTIGIDSTMVCIQVSNSTGILFLGAIAPFFQRDFLKYPERNHFKWLNYWKTDIRVQHPDSSRVSCCPDGDCETRLLLRETQRMNSRLCTGAQQMHVPEHCCCDLWQLS